MAEIEYDSEFDLVTLLGCTFGYLGERGDLELLQRILRALKPGGLAFLQFTPIERWEGKGSAKRDWTEIEGGWELTEAWFDFKRANYYTRCFHVMKDGRIIEPAPEDEYHANQVVRCYGIREMDLHCAAAGFLVSNDPRVQPGDAFLQKRVE